LPLHYLSEFPLHLRPEHVAFVPGFPVECVVPRVVDRLERFAESVPRIYGMRDDIRRTHRIPQPVEPDWRSRRDVRINSCDSVRLLGAFVAIRLLLRLLDQLAYLGRGQSRQLRNFGGRSALLDHSAGHFLDAFL
jgi:hypothetical protein